MMGLKIIKCYERGGASKIAGTWAAGLSPALSLIIFKILMSTNSVIVFKYFTSNSLYCCDYFLNIVHHNYDTSS